MVPPFTSACFLTRPALVRVAPPSQTQQGSRWESLTAVNGTLDRCCNKLAELYPQDDAVIASCISETTAWNEYLGDGDPLNTCSNPIFSTPKNITGSKSTKAWFYGGGSGTKCNNIKKELKCAPNLMCAPLTLFPSSTRMVTTTAARPPKTPPKKKGRAGHRRHSRMLLSE